MPHQCVRCNKFYDDGANEILQGCSCGAKVFFFVRKEKLKEVQETLVAFQNLSLDEKKEMEKDVYNLVEIDPDDNRPVILDLEAIRSLEPGKFELDLVRLFKKDPLIFRIGEGKYIIDLNSVFNQK
ncbi:MAG TPA: Zn-ribbon containing protein [Candidatus Nanoarchaeia archaeon]|nr:Zn-ribbon containing protein [Candidatus Nanoarchaeia archaeon]